MRGAVLAQINLLTILQSPISWGLAVGALGLWVMLVNGSRRFNRLGQLISFVGLIVLAIALPKLSDLTDFDQWCSQIVFWVLSGIAIGCSTAAVTAHNPVYTAIWFAGSLLGVAGLFLFQNAQFLGFATIVVYAGAIVVTFLFVLMLANPEGHAKYDRISWAKLPVPLMILAATALVAIVAASFISQPPNPIGGGKPVLAENHMAHFGGELFAKHLVSVEVAGTILLVALVGAIAIVIQGRGDPAVSPSIMEHSPGREAS